MFRILISELKYYRIIFLCMMIPLILFTLSGLIDLKIEFDLPFLDKYFWSIVIGLGSYLLIYGIGVNRIKEKRERITATLPVTLNTARNSKILFGLSPVILIWFWLEISRLMLKPDWIIFIERTHGQFSLLFIFLVLLSIIYDLQKTRATNSMGKFIVYAILLITLIVSITSLIIYLVSVKIIKPIGIGGEELYFYLWGFLLAVFAGYIYSKKISFTE